MYMDDTFLPFTSATEQHRGNIERVIPKGMNNERRHAMNDTRIADAKDDDKH